MEAHKKRFRFPLTEADALIPRTPVVVVLLGVDGERISRESSTAHHLEGERI